MPLQKNFFTSPYWDQFVDSALLALFLMLLLLIARAVIKSTVKDSKLRHGWQKAATYLCLLLASLLLARIWIVGFRPALTFIGIVAAALILVNRAPFSSLTGRLFISWRGIFSIGDRIQVGEHRGDVIGVGPFYFTLFEVGDAASGYQSTGRILKIPNNLILTMPVVNHSKFFPHVWNELAIVLLPNANWIKAKAIFLQLTEKHTEVYEGSALEALQHDKKEETVILKKTSPKIYVNLQQAAPAGIKLTSRFLCEARAIRETEVAIYEELLGRLKKEPDIQLSFEMPPGFHKFEKQPGTE